MKPVIVMRSVIDMKLTKCCYIIQDTLPRLKMSPAQGLTLNSDI